MTPVLIEVEKFFSCYTKSYTVVNFFIYLTWIFLFYEVINMRKALRSYIFTSIQTQLQFWLFYFKNSSYSYQWLITPVKSIASTNHMANISLYVKHMLHIYTKLHA